MKNLFCVFFVLAVGFSSFAQPVVKLWDRNFGGFLQEFPAEVRQLPDGGFIILASSQSDSGFDKSDPNFDTTLVTNDCWLIRTDANGNKIWDRTYGGSSDEQPSVLIPVPDGFILAATSFSSSSGNKSDTLRGVADYWILRLDTSGNILWDKTVGGPLLDQVTCGGLTSDGFLMFCGYTLSGPGGDKVSPSLGGFDFWWVKLDLSGNLISERTIGGMLSDNCFAMSMTNAGGAYLAGYSDSPVTFNKSEPPRGGYDFWVLKVDSLGRKIWDKTIGGNADDYCFASCNYNGPLKGVLLGGDSFSGVSGEKSQNSRGADDYWVVYLNDNGSVVWDKTFGGSDFDELNSIHPANNGNYLLGGESYSQSGNEKSENNLGAEQTWMIEIDSTGQKLWDKTIFTTAHDEYAKAIPASANTYLAFCFTLADTGGYRSYFNTGAGDIWLSRWGFNTSGVHHAFDKSIFKVYPNPAVRRVFINAPEIQSENSRLVLLDGRGRTVLQQDPVPDYIDIDGLVPGIYTLVLCSTEERVVIRFVKE